MKNKKPKKQKQWTKKEIESAKKQKPDLCIFKISLFDRLKKQSEDFEFKIYIVDTKPVVKDKKEPKKKPKKGKPENEKVSPSEDTLKSVHYMLTSPFDGFGNQSHWNT